MRMIHTDKTGLTNFFCLKCGTTVGALPSASVWCKQGHRMRTKKEIDLAEERRRARDAKKKGNQHG